MIVALLPALTWQLLSNDEQFSPTCTKRFSGEITLNKTKYKY